MISGRFFMSLPPTLRADFYVRVHVGPRVGENEHIFQWVERKQAGNSFLESSSKLPRR